MANIFKRAMASMLAATALGAAPATVQADDLKDNEPPKDDKIEHVVKVDEKSALEKGTKIVADATKTGVNTVADMVTKPVLKTAEVLNEGVKTLADGIGTLADQIGDTTILPTASSVLRNSADLSQTAVEATVNLAKTGVNAAADITGETLQAGATALSGSPKQAALNLAGNVVKNTGELTGSALEQTADLTASAVRAGGNIVSDTVTNAVRPAVNMATSNDDVGKLGKMLPQNLNIAAKGMNYMASTDIQIAGRTAGAALHIAGNAGDAAIRGDLEKMEDALTPHTENLAGAIEDSALTTAKMHAAVGNSFTGTSVMLGTKSVDVGVGSANSAQAEALQMANVMALTTGTTAYSGGTVGLLNTLRSLEQAKLATKLTNETTKQGTQNSETVQEALKTIAMRTGER